MRAIDHGAETAASNNGRLSKRTFLVLTWTFLTLFWSIFTPPHKTFAARVLLFQPAWIIRAIRKDTTWIQDLTLFLGLYIVYTNWAGVWSFSSLGELKQHSLEDPTMQMHTKVFSLLSLCALLAGSIVVRDKHLESKETKIESLHEQRIEDQVLPPLLLASKTTHSRLFPQKHSFTYSYLLVGVPIGIQGRISNMLSVDSQHFGWFVVDSADYLSRGNAHLSLSEKLKRYLHTQGVTDRDYAYAYLVTAPRFLDYSFNPVSFWYIYDSDTALKYMILEVNNTFDERRIRKGSYSLRAVDPLAAYEETGQMRIDNTIVLRSSDEHPKIVARIYSDGEPKDPATISSWEAAKFIAAWCWVGVATFPRIVKEATMLFFRRKLHVWYRPEVAATSLGRSYTEEERVLEAFFRAFISNAVSEASQPLRVVYEPAHHDDAEIVLYSPGFTFEEDRKRTLTIKVTSPAFYSRFVHHPTAKSAFEHECLATDEKNRTAFLEQPGLLPALLEAIEEHSTAAQQPSSIMTSLKEAKWALLTSLRCPPTATSYPELSAPEDQNPQTKESSAKVSELDSFVKTSCEDHPIYWRIAMKLFLAERLALGIPALLTLLDFVFVRAPMLVVAMHYCHHVDVFDVLRPRKLEWEDLGTVVGMLGWANGVHVWSWVKG
ncbi:hypothetical protein D0865_01313 [Hortaea werneckii]|uniref:DUF1365-domain-containing protein n=1 Tax=Hortaea werneckii TaxID=91943 RepID=A0A3M7D997_HORWE|nr:hypothetical protein D0865_01313 [Hortaea werneckii]